MSYKIHRFDVILRNGVKRPAIYIKPDMKLLELLRNNSYAVMVTIEGTDSVYECRLIAGTADKSCNVPNCRPNYYEKTGFYIITLFTTWNGYINPCRLGYAKIMGLEEVKRNCCGNLQNINYCSCDNKSSVIKQIQCKNEVNFFPIDEFVYRKPDTSCTACNTDVIQEV